VQKRERPQPVRVAIDLETTGLRPDQDAIIEIGAVKFAGERVIDTFQSFVAPTAPLPYRIQRLTGIRPGRLNGAPTLAALAPQVREFLGDAPLVGHSVQFDAAFLRRAGLARHNPLIDTYELATLLLPGLPSYTLATVGAALAIPASTYHRALADAQLSREVFLALSARLGALDPSTLQLLDRLAAAPEWTPGPLIRAADSAQRQDQRRQRDASPFGALLQTSLGQQLEAKLGVDPDVLSMAVALESKAAQPAVAPAPVAANTAVEADQAPGFFVEAIAAPAIQLEVAARRRAVSAGMAARLTEGGVSFFEVERNDDSALALLIPIVEWAVGAGGRALIAAANDEQMARVARTLLPQALACVGVAEADAPVAELDEYETYLCLHRWFGVARDPRGKTLSQDLTRGLAKLIVWSRETGVGARSEITLAGQEALAWERARAGGDFVDTSTACAYQRSGYCFTTRAHHAAANAALVVTTHAALAAQLAGRPSLLPDLPDATRVVILDAHLFEEELLQAGAIALERRALLDLLATLAAPDERLDDMDGRTIANAAYTGLLPLAGSLLAPTANGAPSQPREGSVQAIARWKPTARERGWLDTLARTRAATEALFAALRATMLEAQSETMGGQQDQNNQRDQSGGARRQPARRETPEQRTTPVDGRTRQLDAWQDALATWSALDAALAAVASLAREVAQMIQATQSAQRSATASPSTSSARRSKGAQPAAGAPAIAPGMAYGLVADLLGAARRLDQTRGQGAILFAAPTQDDDRVRWLRLPYADTYSPPGDVRNGRPNGQGSSHGSSHGSSQGKSQPQSGANPSGVPAQAATAPSTLQRSSQPAERTMPAAQTTPPTSDAEASAPVNAAGADETARAGDRSSAPEGAQRVGAMPRGALVAGAENMQGVEGHAAPERPSATPIEGATPPGDGAAGAARPADAEATVEGEPPTLHAAPLGVGGLLAPLLAPGHALALAGWSLSVGGDFEYMRGSLGLPDGVGGLAFTQDYAHQTLLCLPADAPEPNAPHFQQRLDEAIVALATALNGDLVALFPSHASLRAGAQGVKRALERRDILALAQGIDGSARQLWQTFHTQPRTVLLGAGAFWDGADQRERPPACVVVTRVPFPPTGDPLVAARSERWSDPQSQFVIPNAALKMRQALGGLAWSHQRRNAVLLYDHRVQSRAYGPTILSALPRCTQAQEPMARLVERIADWTHSAV